MAKQIEEIDQFLSIVDDIVGTYFDATTGFHLVHKQITEVQGVMLQTFAADPKLVQFANLDYLDKQPFTYGKGEPDAPEAVVQHTSTQGEHKLRNVKGGTNYRFIGNLSLILIYQYWEDYYRKLIANTLGYKDKKDLQSPVMGDIRRIRISIIHHRGIALPEIGKCEVIKFFKEGEQIFIDDEKFEAIVGLIRQYLYSLQNSE